MTEFAPIVLFVYNRPQHTRKTVEALRRNPLAGLSDLIVYCDGPKAGERRELVNQVRSYVSRIEGFKTLTVVPRETNRGLAKSIISGVSEILADSDRVIVMEDDLVTSPFFLQYMNDGLNLYAEEERVVSIHGYCYPLARPMPETYFLKGADCWGWATWSRGWALFEEDGVQLLDALRESGMLPRFDFNGSFDYSGMLNAQISGDNDSWAIRWYASALLSNRLTLYPARSLVRNIGNDRSGQHSVESDIYDVDLSETPVSVGTVEISESTEALEAMQKYFISIRPTLAKRVARRLRRILNPVNAS